MAAACTTTGPGGTMAMAMAMSLPRLRLRLCTPSSSVASTCILTTPTFKRIKCIQILMCSVSEFVLGWVLTGLMSRKQGVVFQQAVVTEDRDGDGDGCRRREAMLKMALYLATTAVSLPALADGVDLDEAPAELRVYSDDVNKFKISIPQDWQVGAGESDGIKSITAFFPEGASTSNVSVAITGIGPDFTRLESFGKVDAFAESLVNGLDRSWQRPPGIAAKLIDCKAANGLYYIEYTLQKPGESRRHIYSAIGMANNGWYNRLYTVTGQFVEEESDKFGSTIQKAVQSFILG